MYVCIYRYVCVYVNMYVCIYIYICMYVYVLCIYVCMYMYMYMYYVLCIYVCVYIHVCMCVYVYVNKWFYNILGGIFYSRISRILRMSNTTNITHGSIYGNVQTLQLKVFSLQRLISKSLSMLFVEIIRFICKLTPLT